MQRSQPKQKRPLECRCKLVSSVVPQIMVRVFPARHTWQGAKAEAIAAPKILHLSMRQCGKADLAGQFRAVLAISGAFQQNEPGGNSPMSASEPPCEVKPMGMKAGIVGRSARVVMA